MPANKFKLGPRPASAQQTAPQTPQPLKNPKIEPVIIKPEIPPLTSNNPVIANLTLFKQLSGFPNYGNPSKNADILYTGTHASWDINIPAFLLFEGKFKTQLIIRAVLDDHYNVPANRYSAKISINGSTVQSGRLSLEHGAPAEGLFLNWGEIVLSIPNLRKENKITIENTSAAGPKDWIGFDWIELRQYPR